MTIKAMEVFILMTASTYCLRADLVMLLQQVGNKSPSSLLSGWLCLVKAQIGVGDSIRIYRIRRAIHCQPQVAEEGIGVEQGQALIKYFTPVLNCQAQVMEVLQWIFWFLHSKSFQMSLFPTLQDTENQIYIILVLAGHLLLTAFLKTLTGHNF